MTENLYKDDVNNFACSDGAMLEILLASKTARECLASCRANDLSISIAQSLNVVVNAHLTLELSVEQWLDDYGYIVSK